MIAQLRFQNSSDLRERDGDARMNGALGQIENVGDFAQLQAFAITERENGAGDFRQTQKAGADEGAFFVGGGLGVGRGSEAGEFGKGVAVFVEGGFGAAFGATEFVVAMIEGNAPKPGRE